MTLVAQVGLLVAFPVAAAVVGSVIAAVRPPGPRVVSGIQHFAAGVVMAALIGEVMPALRDEGHLVPTVIGFAAGAFLVLLMGAYGRRCEERDDGGGSLPVGLLAAVAVDLLVDGVLIGLGVRLGHTAGIVLTVALTLELLFLGLSVVCELEAAGVETTRSVLVCSGLGLMTALGAIGSAALLGSAGPALLSAVLAFGAAALLYLVVEELLVDAHEQRETVGLGAMFFLGFLVVYVLSTMDL